MVGREGRGPKQFSQWVLKWHYHKFVFIRQHYLRKGEAAGLVGRMGCEWCRASGEATGKWVLR